METWQQFWLRLPYGAFIQRRFFFQMAGVTYSAEIEQLLSRDFLEVLHEAGVKEPQAKYFADSGILTLSAFVDLADERSEVASKIARPAGIDPENNVLVQPLKSAWRAADAMVKAALEARAKGEEPTATKTLPAGARKRLDAHFKDHFKLISPRGSQPIARSRRSRTF